MNIDFNSSTWLLDDSYQVSRVVKSHDKLVSHERDDEGQHRVLLLTYDAVDKNASFTFKPYKSVH